MRASDDDALAQHALEALPADEAAALEADLAISSTLRARFAAVADSLVALGDDLPAVTPRPSARDALLAAAAPAPERAGRFADALGRLIDRGADAARDLLARIHDAAAWEGSPWPGVQLMHLPGGPATAGADVGFVRVPAGARFPYHRHADTELTLVLQGAKRLDDGRVLGPGEALEMGPGSAHGFTALEGPDLVFAVVLRGELAFPSPPD
jgi:putative transcriptional regulator